MNERRAYLKQLAASSARRWSSAPLPQCFAGETQVETRNTSYQFRDGVCYSVTRHDGGVGRTPPSAFIGMRIVGWLLRDDPEAGVTMVWKLGAYAVLWRPRREDEEHSAVALTSTSYEFRAMSRARPVRGKKKLVAVSRSEPPPPPQGLLGGSFLPRPSPLLIGIPPAPASAARLHSDLAPEDGKAATPPAIALLSRTGGVGRSR